MTTNKPRVVERHEVRAICAAGGEVTDGDGDVWCERDGVFGYDCQLYESFVPAKALFEARADNIGPFTVTKEPPAQESPWRRGVPEKSGWHFYREASGVVSLCLVKKGNRRRHGEVTYALFAGDGEARDTVHDAAWFASTEFAPLRERAPE